MFIKQVPLHRVIVEYKNFVRHTIAPLRLANRKTLHLADQFLLCKRAFIETIIDQLKNIAQIEHTRLHRDFRRGHRSPSDFMINLIGGLIAYCQ